jgi:hypothetical protein
MKIRDHLSNALYPIWHRAHHIMLVLVVDTHVWIGSPDEDSIDSPVAFFKIVKISVDGVLSGSSIVKVEVMHHHLRLNKADWVRFSAGMS